MREIVLDTETTGLSPAHGDRVVEIGCIELINHMPTGKHYHQYINPERPMPDEAFRIHGLGDDFLKDQPVMADVIDGFLEFAGDDVLIIHNAEFDMGFLNAELDMLNLPQMPMSRAVDTVRMAREKFPGAPASLDALCKRFEIDNSTRTFHGALLDAQLLAEVYLELAGGRQPDLELAAEKEHHAAQTSATGMARRDPRPHTAGKEELEAHSAFMEKITDPIWDR